MEWRERVAVPVNIELKATKQINEPSHIVDKKGSL
jgi:hypothetical protein